MITTILINLILLIESMRDGEGGWEWRNLGEYLREETKKEATRSYKVIWN